MEICCGPLSLRWASLPRTFPTFCSDWGRATVLWLDAGALCPEEGRLLGIRPGVRPFLGLFVNLFEPHSFYPDSETVKGSLRLRLKDLICEKPAAPYLEARGIRSVVAITTVSKNDFWAMSGFRHFGSKGEKWESEAWPRTRAGVLSRFSHVRLFATLWTVARQAPLSMGSSRQEYWSGLPFPFPGDLPNPRTEPAFLTSSALAGRFFTTSTTWEDPGHS